MRDEEKLRRSSPPLGGRDGPGSSQNQEAIRDRTFLPDGIDLWRHPRLTIEVNFRLDSQGGAMMLELLADRPTSKPKAGRVIRGGLSAAIAIPVLLALTQSRWPAAGRTRTTSPSPDGTPTTPRSRWTPQAALWSSGSASTARTYGSRPGPARRRARSVCADAVRTGRERLQARGRDGLNRRRGCRVGTLRRR
jgi:hypothetical protein